MAAPAIDGLVQTPYFNELTSYDAHQIDEPDFFGFNAQFVAPLTITNVLPQNSIIDIAVAGGSDGGGGGGDGGGGTSVPEPAGWTALAMGLLALGGVRGVTRMTSAAA